MRTKTAPSEIFSMSPFQSPCVSDKKTPVFVDAELKYPQIYPKVKHSMLFDIWNIPKWGIQNPLWGASLMALAAIIFIIGSLAPGLQRSIFILIMGVAYLSSIVIGPVGLILFIIEMSVYFMEATRWQKADFQVRRQAEIDRIANSPEYKETCNKIYDQYLKDYEQAKQKYEKEIAEQPTKIAEAESDLKSKQNTAEYLAYLYYHTEETLDELYNADKLIPINYLEQPIVEIIYQIMDSSIYDTKTAIEMYDRQKEHYLKQAQIEETQRYNELQAEANQIGYANLEAQMEANDIADRARRDRNVADAIKIYQNHRIIKNTRR